VTIQQQFIRITGSLAIDRIVRKQTRWYRI